MTTKVVSANTMKTGSFIVIDDVACRVVDVSTSKPGKHGSSKVRIAAMGLFDNRRREIVMPGSDSVQVPIIEKKTAQVLSITGDSVNVMDSETYETFDLAIPDELKGSVTEGCQVLYWVILGQKVMKQVKGE